MADQRSASSAIHRDAAIVDRISGSPTTPAGTEGRATQSSIALVRFAFGQPRLIGKRGSGHPT
jgi:hypothetical protein